jgi:hypothetical protein
MRQPHLLSERAHVSLVDLADLYLREVVIELGDSREGPHDGD